MVAKDPLTRLRHILEEIDGVAAATEGLTVVEILDAYPSRRMVERAIQIISEAAKELPPDVRGLEPTVPWQNIIGKGNFLRHEYHQLDRSTLEWIVSAGMPALRPVVVRLIAHLQTNS